MRSWFRQDPSAQQSRLIINGTPYLHGHSAEEEEIEFEQTDHDLVPLVHSCGFIISTPWATAFGNGILFILGFAPTTWKMAQLK